MQEILLAIVFGIAIGLFNLLSYKVKFYLNKFPKVCLCTLLFCLGTKIGCDDALLAKLGTLGIQAGAIAAGAVAGSIACVFMVTKLIARPADAGEEDVQ